MTLLGLPIKMAILYLSRNKLNLVNWVPVVLLRGGLLTTGEKLVTNPVYLGYTTTPEDVTV